MAITSIVRRVWPSWKPCRGPSRPNQVNPLNFNPLRGVLEELIDFDTVRHASRVKLFISATNVSSGRARIFENRDISPDVLLASACLQQLFQAAEIDG